MQLSKIISIFKNNNVTSVSKADLADPAKKYDPVVKITSNIFDSNYDGNLNEAEQAILNKIANLDSNNTNISMTDLQLFAAMNGPSSDLSFYDLKTVKNDEYEVLTNGNNTQLNTYDSQQRKSLTTTINEDGSMVTTASSSNGAATTTKYNQDYKIQEKTISNSNGTEQKYMYNDDGLLVQKYETSTDGSNTTTSYNLNGKILLTVKQDSNNAFVSKSEYEYDENGNTTSVLTYNSENKITEEVNYDDEKNKIQIKYNDDGDIIQSNSFNKYSKQLTSFIKNEDGSSASSAYEYQTNGKTKITVDVTDVNGSHSQQISTSDRKGNKEVYTDGILTQKDEVNKDWSKQSTVYSAENIINTVTKTDAKGNITAVNHYSYTGSNINNVISKDAQGNTTGTSTYNYDANELVSIDHLNSTGILDGKITYNTDSTKTKYTYNDGNVVLTETYGTDDRIINSVENTEDGWTLSSAYTYNTPNSGDINITTNKTNGTETYAINKISHSNGSAETNTYNSNEELIQNDILDKYGKTLSTLYNDNGQTVSVTNTDANAKLIGKDNYIYTNGILSSVNHFGANNISAGVTQYDESGNTIDYNSAGKIIATRTTDPITNAVTTQSYKYNSYNTDKIITTSVTLNGKTQSRTINTVHLDNSAKKSIYSGTPLRITQTDDISADGKIKSTIYDTKTYKIAKVINTSANGTVLNTNMYNYATNGKLSSINFIDADNNLVQKTEFALNGNKTITNYDINGEIKDAITYDKNGNVISLA